MSVGEGDGTRRVAELVDHNLLAGQDQYAGVELVLGDGDSRVFQRVGTSLQYRPMSQNGASVNDGSLLSFNPTGSNSAANPAWTYVDEDGLAATFGPGDASTGKARMLTLQESNVPGGPRSLD